MRATDLNEIERRAVSKLRKYKSAPTAERTELLRDVAIAFVDARPFFYTKEAEIDWRGSTHAYRSWVREVFTQAGIAKEATASLQAAIRYHSGNIIRDRLDVETLRKIGLMPESPRERAAEKRASASETTTLFGGGGPITDFESLLSAASTIEAALARSSVDAAKLSSPELAELRAAYRRVCTLAEELAGAASE